MLALWGLGRYISGEFLDMTPGFVGCTRELLAGQPKGFAGQ